MPANTTSADALSLVDQQLVDNVLAGQRRALAKTITLIESTRNDHQQRAQKVLWLNPLLKALILQRLK